MVEIGVYTPTCHMSFGHRRILVIDRPGTGKLALLNGSKFNSVKI